MTDGSELQPALKAWGTARPLGILSVEHQLLNALVATWLVTLANDMQIADYRL
ncbi:MAG: hypothetical protein O3B74_07505 [Proteobacteria bacterium]|nr:hypothetical protein [Pseudomonadota bacterium]MDA1310149.1 hypothetical protein [Pseudomonadota bacterium]